MPGIYCISGDVSLSGNASFTGAGLVLYFRNGGMTFTGNSWLKISGPTTANCLGSQPSSDPTESCAYGMIAIFAARNNHSSIEVRGNGENAIIGLVYALNGTVKARGGGNSPEDAVIVGQVIASTVDLRGGADCKVTYNAGATYPVPTRLSLQR